MNIQEWGDLDKYKQYWGNSKSILNRMTALSNSVANIIKQYAPLAKTLEDFLQKLRKESKSTPHPAMPIENLLTTTL